MSRRGLSLIEILVVMTIISVLTGMILAAVNAFGIGAKGKKSLAVLGQVHTALQLTAANRGGLPTGAEHPLAGSREPRLAFVRAAGGAVASSGEALRGVNPTQVPLSAASRVLADDDRFADPALPLLYGVSRDRIGILGANIAAVTAYRLLLPPPRHGTGMVDPTGGSQIAPTAGPDANAATLAYIFGSSNAQAELAALGALGSPPDDTALILDNRVWSDNASGAGAWKPGRVRDGSLAGLPNWKLYRLRGLAVYDAWRHEVLFATSADGRLSLISAGPDGAAGIAPGPDGGFQSPAEAGTPANGDLDGTRDNIVLGK